MQAFVGVTDSDWYRHLAALRELDEVNFWTPHPWRGRFGILERGQPLLFKLKAPDNAIVGGGFFEHYTKLPISLAWNTFGEKNGAASLEEAKLRIARLRHEQIAPWVDYPIGCILLVEPFFWPRDLWIPQPTDWKPNIVRGKTYDLRAGIGLDLWQQVVQRLEAASGVGRVALPERQAIPGGFGDPLARPHRLGQGTFRAVITDLYGRQCAVTRERALPALEAAHIRPFHEEPTHEIRNGLLLRSDVHRLFDSGYITVTPKYRVEVSHRMHDDFDDGRSYITMHGSSVHVPELPEYRPDPANLSWHNENKYRG